MPLLENDVIFAYLNESYSNHTIAEKILDEIQLSLQNMGLSVLKAPFGWEKTFSLTCKGHPLAQALRVVYPTDERGSS